MAKQFTPRAVIFSTSTHLVKQFCEALLPEEATSVPWERDLFVHGDVTELITMGMSDQERKRQVISHLEDIYSASNLKQIKDEPIVFFNRLGVTLPDDVETYSVEDIVMWVFLNDKKFWELTCSIMQSMTISPTYYYSYALRTEGGDPIEDDENPDKATLCAALKEEFKKRKDGVGENIDVSFVPYHDEERYICSVSTNSCHEAQFDMNGNLVNKTVSLPRLLVYIYNRTTKTVSLTYRGADKHLRKRLCEIWADVIKGAECSDEQDLSIPYHLSVFKDPEFKFIQDPEGYLDRAYIKKVTIARQGVVEGDKLSYSTTNALDGLKNVVNQENFPLDSCDIVEISLCITLNDGFGRCKKQTLNLKTDSSDLENKNPKVKNALRSLLVFWGVLDA